MAGQGQRRACEFRTTHVQPDDAIKTVALQRALHGTGGWAVRGLPLAPRLFPFRFSLQHPLLSFLFSRENSVEIVKFWALSRV